MNLDDNNLKGKIKEKFEENILSPNSCFSSSWPTDVTEDERICACPQEQSIAILRTYCPVRDIIRGGFLEARLYCYVELRGLEFAQRGVPPRQV